MNYRCENFDMQVTASPLRNLSRSLIIPSNSLSRLPVGVQFVQVVFGNAAVYVVSNTPSYTLVFQDIALDNIAGIVMSKSFGKSCLSLPAVPHEFSEFM